MSFVTTVSASGVAEGRFDSVSFNVSVRGRGSTGPQAKEATQEVTSRLYAAVQQLKDNGVSFKEGKNRSTLDLQKEERWNDETGQQVFVGYLAAFSLSVQTKDVERATEIQDVLTSVEGAEVGSPTFGVEPEHRRALQREAIKAAFTVVSERLNEECEVLGLKPESLEIGQWSADYNERGFSHANNFVAKASYAMDAAGGGAEAIEIQSGQADVRVTLSVSFKRVVR